MKKEKVYKVVFLVWTCLLIYWQVYVTLKRVPNFLVPGTWEIIIAISKNYPRLFFHLWWTFLEVVSGLGLAVVVAVIVAVISVYFTTFEIVVFSLIVGLMTIPKVAIAPLLVIVLGFGIWPKIVLSSFMAFFPIVVNATKGLKGVNPEIQDLLRVYRANRRETLFMARIPNSMPDFFGGLKTAVPLSTIGAIVGEYIGSNRGLGYLIMKAQDSFNIPLMFGSIFFLAMMGMALFQAVKFIEREVIAWHLVGVGENNRPLEVLW